MSRKLLPSRYEEIKQTVADLLEERIVLYPVDVIQMAQRMGVVTITHPNGFSSEEKATYITTDGYTTFAEDSLGTLIVMHLNTQPSIERQRFTAAHELGHIWLGHLEEGSSSLFNVQEAEANFFASYFLAPDVLIRAWTPDATPTSIMQQFGMSFEAAEHSSRRYQRALAHSSLNRDYDQRILNAAFKGNVFTCMSDLTRKVSGA